MFVGLLEEFKSQIQFKNTTNLGTNEFEKN